MKCTYWQVVGRGGSKKGNNIKLCEKVKIGPATLMKFAVVMETSTKDRDTIDTKISAKGKRTATERFSSLHQSSYQT